VAFLLNFMVKKIPFDREIIALSNDKGAIKFRSAVPKKSGLFCRVLFSRHATGGWRARGAGWTNNPI